MSNRDRDRPFPGRLHAGASAQTTVRTAGQAVSDRKLQPGLQGLCGQRWAQKYGLLLRPAAKFQQAADSP